MSNFIIPGLIFGLLITPFGLGLIKAQTVHVYCTNNALETGSIPGDPVAEFPQTTNASSGSKDDGTITLNPSIKFRTLVGVGA